ncbi:MAG TPA: hypothetical protein VFN54_09270 [Acidimicrobiales bacterium]|nr:hypothetical protein [Acidimicrobiales bacterium]
MGLKGMVISGISMVVGAIMYWAVTAQSTYAAQSHGFRLSTVGVILLIAGAVGFIVSTIVYATSRRAPAAPPRQLDREVIDEDGRRSILHEEQR